MSNLNGQYYWPKCATFEMIKVTRKLKTKLDNTVVKASKYPSNTSIINPDLKLKIINTWPIKNQHIL